MHRTNLNRFILAAALVTSLGGCASYGTQDNWTHLVDGTRGLENFDRIGDAVWKPADGAIEATQPGKVTGYLVTRKNYRDFELRAEIWATPDANSGIFMRCKDAKAIDDESCYEVNIFDQRPDQTYATGAIVKVAAVAQPAPKAGGKWNTFEVSMKGNHLVVVMNGQKTVDVRDSKFADGPIALQLGRGTVKFRKVSVRTL